MLFTDKHIDNMFFRTESKYADYETFRNFYDPLRSSNIPVLSFNIEEVISPADVNEIGKVITRENCLSFVF